MDAFAEKGLHGTSTETIARAVGISQPYLFRLYGTKKELFLAAVRRCFDDTLDRFRLAVQEGTPDMPVTHWIGAGVRRDAPGRHQAPDADAVVRRLRRPRRASGRPGRLRPDHRVRRRRGRGQTIAVSPRSWVAACCSTSWRRWTSWTRPRDGPRCFERDAWPRTPDLRRPPSPISMTDFTCTEPDASHPEKGDTPVNSTLQRALDLRHHRRGAADGDPRQPRRDHRAARHPPRVGRVARGPRVDRQRLHAHLRRRCC